jgi:hypothetical protein
MNENLDRIFTRIKFFNVDTNQYAMTFTDFKVIREILDDDPTLDNVVRIGSKITFENGDKAEVVDIKIEVGITLTPGNKGISLSQTGDPFEDYNTDLTILLKEIK